MTTMAEANTVARDTWPRRVQRAADLAAIDTPSRRHSPYVGAHLRGSVERTYLRGRRIYERGKAFGKPAGCVLAPNG
jgi:hypothetical protein